MSQLFKSSGQSIGTSVSASVLPMKIQDLFSLALTGLISLQSKGLSRVFFNTTSSKASIFWCSTFFMVQLSHPYMTTGKTIVLDLWTFVGKVKSLLFNTGLCSLHIRKLKHREIEYLLPICCCLVTKLCLALLRCPWTIAQPCLGLS